MICAKQFIKNKDRSEFEKPFLSYLPFNLNYF